MKKFSGLYCITGSDLTKGRGNIYSVKKMIEAGIKVIQYREKVLNYSEKVKEAKEIAYLCKKHDVCFIVNDHVDIALLVNADGVHIGQDDMSVADVRTLIGSDKIIGVSTHSEAQAQKAVSDGADYIGVGPIYETQTKDTSPVGLGYLDYAVNNIDIPFVAIGGIKENNIDIILEHGAKWVCIVSDVLGTEKIEEKIAKINQKFK